MEQKYRLPPVGNMGGKINRDKPINFTFDGVKYTGYEGDSLASALLANGVKMVGRSFKYHRPRGLLTNGQDEPNGLAQLGVGARTTPNVKMPVQPLYEGLIATSQNRFPSLMFDIGAVNQLFSGIFSAGFYYKTFMGPYNRAWMVWEWFIRRAAGLGRAPKDTEYDPDKYERVNYFCDILVIGGDDSAIIAANNLAKDGLRVIYTNPQMIQAERPAALLPTIEYLGKTEIVAHHDGGVFIGYQQPHNHLAEIPQFEVYERILVFHARACVYAGGVNEYILPFSNNDTPGVMKFHSAMQYLRDYAVMPGERVVIATNNNSIYAGLHDLVMAGVKISAIIDMRNEILEGDIELANAHNINIYANAYPFKVFGRHCVNGVSAGIIGINGQIGDMKHFACDALLVSGGFQPNLQLLGHRNASTMKYNKLGDCHLAVKCDDGIFLCGTSAGVLLPEYFEAVANECTHNVKKYLGMAVGRTPIKVEPCFHNTISLSQLPQIGKKAFVDYQHDVVVDDIYLAAREGYHFVEHLKRYTTMGMATDQGRNGQEAALHILANILEDGRTHIGSPRMRPPAIPVSLGAIASNGVGAHLKPKRFTPFHQFMLANGAVMTEAGLWYRPWYYPKDKKEELGEAYIREMIHVRSKVGICDVSTLGKIMVQGRDSAEFLDRIYVNNIASLPVNKCRYGVMLREDGVVMDDGTIWRFGEHNYMITTTTANAGKVMDFLEEMAQVYFTDLQVTLSSVTDQWAALSIAGPHSRSVLQKFLPDIDIGNENIPHMGIIKTKILGANMMIARLSFSGELAYEIFIQSNKAVEILEAIMFVGKDFDLQFYGLEALGGLRIEKGHPVGSELDGRTTLDDLNMGKMAKIKPFIGKAMMNRGILADPNRPKLVGLESIHPNRPILSGSIIQETDEEPLKQGHGSGWVSSMTYSPTLKKYIALGFVRNGRNRHGQIVNIADPLRTGYTTAKIVSPVFVDPSGKKYHG